jgi:hypothetical protein
VPRAKVTDDAEANKNTAAETEASTIRKYQ